MADWLDSDWVAAWQKNGMGKSTTAGKSLL